MPTEPPRASGDAAMVPSSHPDPAKLTDEERRAIITKNASMKTVPSAWQVLKTERRPEPPPNKMIMFPADERAEKQYRADLRAWEQRQAYRRAIEERDRRLGITAQPFTVAWHKAHKQATEKPTEEQANAVAAHSRRRDAARRSFLTIRLIGGLIAAAFCVQGALFVNQYSQSENERRDYLSRPGYVLNDPDSRYFERANKANTAGAILSFGAAIGLVLLWAYPLALGAFACLGSVGWAIWDWASEPDRYIIRWPVVGLILVEAVVLWFFASVAYAYRNPHRNGP